MDVVFILKEKKVEDISKYLCFILLILLIFKLEEDFVVFLYFGLVVFEVIDFD